MRLRFLGAAETVTGSRFLVEANDQTVLVDCGLFQGIKRLRLMNWEPFPFPPADIGAVLVTHAHIDHSGYLPALVRDGFAGPIHCSRATADLLELVLLDSAHLQEEDARFANRHRTSRHDPAKPLYTTEDAERALERIRPVEFDENVECLPGIRCSFRPNGHILGSSTVRVAADGTSILFTGDVGRPSERVMQPPMAPPAADIVVTESTYGNRLHADADPASELADVVRRTLGRGGSVVIPSFAVGRAQTVLTLLADLMADGSIPEVPVHLNSPMSISATEIFVRHHDLHRLSAAECERLRSGVEFVRTVEESKLLTSSRGPRIVVTASGMATGGRVLHHLRHLAPDHRNSIVFVGYQAAGTRGDSLVSGAREIKIFGDYVPVRAEVVSIGGLSAHADRDELIAWLGSGELDPRHAFVVHGEPAAADAFRRTIVDRLGWAASVPVLGEVVDLGRDGITDPRAGTAR